jgi:hypothetical protein
MAVLTITEGKNGWKAMYVVVNTFYALPGKFSELIDVLQEASAFGKAVNGVDAIVLPLSAANLARSKLAGKLKLCHSMRKTPRKHPEFQAMSEKLVVLLVPNVSRSEI